jgi:hypothetical protein
MSRLKMILMTTALLAPGAAFAQATPEQIFGLTAPQSCPEWPLTTGWGLNCVPSVAMWDKLFSSKADGAATPPLSPLTYGAKGDGLTDDTADVQTAMNVAVSAGIPLLFDGTHLYRITAPLTASGKIDIEGTLPGGNDGVSNAKLCTSGLVTTSNINLLVLTGEQAIVRGMCLQMAPTGQTATAGTAIMLGGHLGYYQAHDDISHNTIFRPYYGIEFGGDGGLVRESQANDNIIRSPGAIALSVGRGTTGGSTVGIELVNNRIGCDYFDVNGVGFAFFNGAVKWDGTTSGPAVCGINTEIIPGAGQNVNGEFTGVLGDSAGDNGGVTNPMELYIEPQAASGTVSWLFFHDVWAGALSNAASATNVYIGNKFAGNCSNISFNGLTAHSNGHTQTTMIDIEGCLNILITGSDIDTWTGTVTNGILLNDNNGLGPKFVNISGNRFGNVASGHMTNGINLQTNGLSDLNYLTVSGNQIGGEGFITNPLVTDLIQGQDSSYWTVAANEGVDDACPTIASASSINLSGYSCVHLTGTTPVTTFWPGWYGRKVTVIADNGLSLNTGGSYPGMCGSNITIPSAGMATLQYNHQNGCWMHQ